MGMLAVWRPCRCLRSSGPSSRPNPIRSVHLPRQPPHAAQVQKPLRSTRAQVAVLIHERPAAVCAHLPGSNQRHAAAVAAPRRTGHPKTSRTDVEFAACLLCHRPFLLLPRLCRGHLPQTSQLFAGSCGQAPGQGRYPRPGLCNLQLTRLTETGTGLVSMSNTGDVSCT